MAAYLFKSVGLSGWWSQMVAGEYEKSRGLRAGVGQICDSQKFQASVQRTLAVSAARAYRALTSAHELRAWLSEDAEILASKGGKIVLPGMGEGNVRVVEKNKRLRLAFRGRGAAKSTVEITFTPAGPNKPEFGIRNEVSRQEKKAGILPALIGKQGSEENTHGLGHFIL